MSFLEFHEPDPVHKCPDFCIRAGVLAEGRRGCDRGIVIVPPFGGLTFADRHLARQLARTGVCVVAVASFTESDARSNGWDVHADGLLRGRAAVLRVMRWLQAERGVARVSLVGASMGALFAGMAASASSSVDRLALIVAAACAGICRLNSGTWRDRAQGVAIWW